MAKKNKVQVGLFVRNPNFNKTEINEDQKIEENNDMSLGSDGEEVELNEDIVSDQQNEESDESNNSDEVEELSEDEAGEVHFNGKRKRPKSEKTKTKKAKLTKALNKPLTVDEINELKETEDLYHSNLFRMQIDETLKEIKIRKKHVDTINTWIDRLTLLLNGMKEREIQVYLTDDKYPLKFQPTSTEKLGSVVYYPPERVGIYGSQASGTNIGPNITVDVFLTLSSKYLKHDDYANQTYFHKRALFLIHIFKKLHKKSELCDSVEFRELNNDPMKPIICVKSEEISYLIHVIPKQDFFKLNRFIPKTNNIKFRTWKEGEPLIPTPHYNSSILYDITIEKNQKFIENLLEEHENVKNAIKLLKIWMKQRQFDDGYHGISGFIIIAYLIHLIQIHKIFPTMSCYQIVRLFWNQFGNSSLDKKGVSVCQQKNQPNQPNLEEFHKFFDIVLVDSTGYCNVLANVSLDLYNRVREESLNAIKSLNNKNFNSFQLLFMTKFPFHLQFDHILVLKKDEELFKSITAQSGNEDDQTDYYNNVYPHLRKILMNVLRRGLGRRVKSLVPFTNAGDFIVGLQLNPDEALNVVDKGPQANDPEAEEFRKFWGSKAEIRRFKDGSITESVLWAPADSPFGEKRLICQKIVLHLLEYHFKIPTSKLIYVADQFDVVIRQLFRESHELNEEKSLKCIQTFDEIAKELRSLNDLPLEITTVLGTDAVFRYCDPMPPSQNATVNQTGMIGKVMAKFRAHKIQNGIIQLASSGKWPDDLEAMCRIKAAFYIEISKKMNARYKSTIVEPFADCIEVLKNGILYRLKIFHPKEISLTKEFLSSNNLTKLYKNNEKSLKLELDGSIMPKLTSALHGLHHQYSSFGATVAIAKRWLNSQLIDSYLWPDEVTEIIVADMFLKTGVQPAMQPQTGFFRFLAQLANTDWQHEMVIVNFNDEMSSEEIEILENRFQKNRKEFPAMCLVTSCDFQKYSIWTSKAPSIHMIHRVRFLAQNALDLLAENVYTLSRKCVSSLFVPSLEGYNFIINLNDKYVKKSDIVVYNYSQFKPIEYVDRPGPPAGIHFVNSYLNELREAFDHVAVFFYDQFSGNKIAVLWKPSVFEEQEFTTTHINACYPVNGKLMINIEAILKDFNIMGKGLVDSIEKLE